MIKEIQTLFHDGIVKEFAQRYNLSFDDLTYCGGFESFVYQGANSVGEFIIKITHSIKKDIRLLLSEAEFVTYLYNHGVPVSPVVHSRYGNSVESIPSNEGSFYALCYVKAAGAPAKAEQWNDELLRQWGQIMGRTHCLTKTFKPSGDNFHRLHWHENERLKLEKLIPAGQDKVLRRADELVAILHSLEQTTDTYGLVHNDFHQSNFFVADGKITLFDFDDMEYSWFASDIAIVLYYAIYWRSLKQQTEQGFAQRFFETFMSGYSTENSIPGKWQEQIPYFLRLRHIILYAALCEAYDLSNLTPQQDNLLQRMRREIEEDAVLIVL